MSRKIEFVAEDLAPSFASYGIDPDTLTEYEWRKYQDAFCEAAGWTEAAEVAASVIHTIRKEQP